MNYTGNLPAAISSSQLTRIAPRFCPIPITKNYSSESRLRPLRTIEIPEFSISNGVWHCILTMAPEIKEAKRDPRAWDSLTPPLADFLLEAISSMGFARMTYANPLWPLKEQFLTIEFQSCTSGYNSTGMCGKYANSSSHPLLTLHGSFLPIKML